MTNKDVSTRLIFTHLVAKPEDHQYQKVLHERNEDEDHADQDPGYEGADSIRGWDAASGAVVQVDRHQEQGEEKAKPATGADLELTTTTININIIITAITSQELRPL